MRLLVAANNPKIPSAPNIWLGRVLPILRAKGWSPEVLFFSHDGQPGFVSDWLKSVGIPTHLKQFSTTERNVCDVLEVAAARQTRVFLPNVNVASYYATPWLRQRGVRTVGILRSDDRFHWDLIEHFIHGEERFRIDAAVGVSEALVSQITSGAPVGCPVTAIPSGAPVPDQAAKRGTFRFRLVYAGRMVRAQKAIPEVVDSLIRLFQDDPNFEATLLGDGPEREPMMLRVREAGLADRIHFPGLCSPLAVSETLLKHDAFFLLSDFEGLSTALVEAMACGLPPIVLRMRSGLDEILRDGENGLIVDDRFDGFHRAAQNLRRDATLWSRLSTAARKTIVDRFSSQHCAERWDEFLQKLLRSTPAAKSPTLSSHIEIPQFGIDPKGIRREDFIRESGAPLQCPPTMSDPSDPFLHPPLEVNNVDRYWVRHSILEALKRHLPAFHGTFLDVGCGVMPYRNLITDSMSQVSRYIGLDLETDIYTADVDLRWDGVTIPLDDNSVDSAMATEVLEHCPDPRLTLREIRRVLRPGGILFFTVPFLWPIHDSPGDFHRYTPPTLLKLLKEAGFASPKIEALGGWNASLAQMIGLWLKRAPLNEATRQQMVQNLYPLYQQLVQADQKPTEVMDEGTMATGWSGIAVAPEPPRREVARIENLCVARYHERMYSETFIDDHVELLGKDPVLLHGRPPAVFFESGRGCVLAPEAFARLKQQPPREEAEALLAHGLSDFLARRGVRAILAEYGPIANALAAAAAQTGIPLIAHFHGYDASLRDLMENARETYGNLFARAARIVVVSNAMYRALVDAGAPKEKLVMNPYGVEIPAGPLAAPADAPPTFLSVGRFVGKKSPQRTIQAFALVHRSIPDAKLLMAGDGDLLAECEQIVAKLSLQNAVTFLGVLSRPLVRAHLRRVRGFVQHSVVAPDGDSEGLPVGILEAGAMGLPIVSTRHAGIPDAVREDIDGILVEEGDVPAMAEAMLRLANLPDLAREMGNAFHQRVVEHYNRARSLDGLSKIIREAMG